MAIVVGLIDANIMYCVHRFLPTTPTIDPALTEKILNILFLAVKVEEQCANIQIHLNKTALQIIDEENKQHLSNNELIKYNKENLEQELTNTSENLNFIECVNKEEAGIELY